MEIESNNTDNEMFVQSSTNRYTMENLAAGGWYSVLITSTGINDRSNLEPSRELTFQTTPLPPSNIEVTEVTTDQIHLSWDEVLGELISLNLQMKIKGSLFNFRKSYRVAD